MMSISSPAGRRLAVAKADMDAAWEEVGRLERESADPTSPTYLQWCLVGRKSIREPAYRAAKEFDDAAKAVAEELIAQRFHEMEGD